MSSFKSFIVSMLNIAELNDKNIKIMTSDENMLRYKVAFTHKSLTTDAAENYEKLEFFGDSIVNNCVSQYIMNKFPDIVNIKWLTRLKHNLISKKTLSQLAEQNGFFEHIHMNENLVNRFITLSLDQLYETSPGSGHLRFYDIDDNHTQAMIDNAKDILHSDEGSTRRVFIGGDGKERAQKESGYLSLLEDTFEAFIGNTSIIMDESKGVIGPGFALAYKIIEKLLDGLDISLDYKDVWDPKTRIKEQAFDKFKWSMRNAFKTEELTQLVMVPGGAGEEQRYFKTTLYAWPKGDKKQIIENRVIIGTGTGRTKIKAENNAALAGIEVLKNQYGIVENVSNPRTRHNI